MGTVPMKILTFTSLFPNSVEPELGVFVYQRMAHFARRPGNLVRVVAPVPYFPAWARWCHRHAYSRIPRHEEISPLEVFHPRYPLIPKLSMPLHGFLMFAGSLATVRRLHREYQFDCVDAHYVYPDGLAAVLLGETLGLQVVVSARGTDMNLFPAFRSVRPLIRWTLRRVAGGIGVSTPLLEAMIQNGLPSSRGRVIGNGVDPTRFYTIPREQARQQLGIAPDRKVLVSVGALKPAKGFHLLIPAFAKIASAHPDAVLYIIGRGRQQRELERLAHQCGIESSIVFAGACPNDQLVWYYNAADVSCLISSREGWPNVLLESMACGSPVVATGVGGVPAVIASSDLGIIVDQTVDSTSTGLEAALQKKWDRQQIARYARGRSWDVVAAEVEKYFCAILQGRATRH